MTPQLLREMTAQQVYDKAVQHITKQGKPAFDKITGSPCYRNSDGDRCPVGIFLPDDFIEAETNSLSAQTPAVLSALFGSPTLTREDEAIYRLLKDLQGAHDLNFKEPDAVFKDKFIATAIGIARANGLDPREAFNAAA